jgi:hypothetical protein
MPPKPAPPAGFFVYMVAKRPQSATIKILADEKNQGERLALLEEADYGIHIV